MIMVITLRGLFRVNVEFLVEQVLGLLFNLLNSGVKSHVDLHKGLIQLHQLVKGSNLEPVLLNL